VEPEARGQVVGPVEPGVSVVLEGAARPVGVVVLAVLMGVAVLMGLAALATAEKQERLALATGQWQ
jgi:hypothetical protein